MLLGVALLLVGCGQEKGPDEVDTTSIVIDSRGGVVSYLVDDEFDREYYVLSDLTSMVIEEAAAYNTEHQQGETSPVTVDGVEAFDDGTRVVVTQRFDSAETFADFNGAILFYGTVEQALGEGYDLEVSLTGAKDGAAFAGERLLEAPQQHVLITDQKAVIYCPAKVTYVSDGVALNADGSVDTGETEGLAVIVMK